MDDFKKNRIKNYSFLYKAGHEAGHLDIVIQTITMTHYIIAHLCTVPYSIANT